MNTAKVTLGVSLKMYFGYEQTLAWSRAIAALLREHPQVRSGAIEVFVIPSFPMLAPAVEIFDGLAQVGAQDLCWEDNGAWTGEVSPAVLAEMGCRLAEIGHAERRRHFGETDRQIADKTAAAWRNGLTPVLCLGEANEGSVAHAVQVCTAQLQAALAPARAAGLSGELILAYEPQWAIGAAEPAPPAYIGEVCEQLRGQGTRVIYGGSAKPGLLSTLGGRVDGLFLGRFAHDPQAFAAILDEAAAQCVVHQREPQSWQSA